MQMAEEGGQSNGEGCIVWHKEGRESEVVAVLSGCGVLRVCLWGG